MSVQADRERWVVRWRDGSGRQRGRRFESEASARAFDAGLREVAPRERRADGAQRAGGVYPYPTKRGTRWYFKVRDSSGRQTSRRGFASETAARDAKRRLVEQVERGEVRHTRESFGEHWQRWLARRKPYLEAGTWRAYETDGRKRLLQAFESIPLGRLGVEQVRAWMEEQAEAVDAGEIAPKTVNNTLGTLVVCLNAAVEDGLLAANPALRVPRLPPAHIERDYLRLSEIPLYLDSCSALYRPRRWRCASATSSWRTRAARSSSTARASAAKPSDRPSPTASARSRSAQASPACSATTSPAAPRWPLRTRAAHTCS
jgi:hypothetical protein